MFARRNLPDERQDLTIHHEISHITMNLLLTDHTVFTGGAFFLGLDENATASVEQGQLVWHPGYMFVTCLPYAPFSCCSLLVGSTAQICQVQVAMC
jgi:hypothetical protein